MMYLGAAATEAPVPSLCHDKKELFLLLFNGASFVSACWISFIYRIAVIVTAYYSVQFCLPVPNSCGERIELCTCQGGNPERAFAADGSVVAEFRRGRHRSHQEQFVSGRATYLTIRFGAYFWCWRLWAYGSRVSWGSDRVRPCNEDMWPQDAKDYTCYIMLHKGNVRVCWNRWRVVSDKPYMEQVHISARPKCSYLTGE